MKITILTVGKIKEKFFRGAVEEYAEILHFNTKNGSF